MQRIGEPHNLGGTFVAKSTIDFMGYSRGQCIMIDTKATTNTTSLPISNLKEHQQTILLNAEYSGAISGYVVWFVNLKEMYGISATQVDIVLKEEQRRSIPISFFRDYCYRFEYQITKGISNFGDGLGANSFLFFMKKHQININDKTLADIAGVEREANGLIGKTLRTKC